MRTYGQELFVLCHYADKSCDHKHYDGGDMFLICHVISREHSLKGYVNLWMETRWQLLF